MQSGEFELIEKIRRRAARATGQHFGIGDDCAALCVPTGQELLTSTDMLLENIHFRRDWTDLYSLGFKAVAVNISDIAAMGGEPQCLLVGLGLPAQLRDAEVDALLDGIFAGCEAYAVFLAGGDTCRSDSGLLISVTVQGFSPLGEKLTRAGARVGEDLWVSGTLGDSALALEMLRGGEKPSAQLAERHFRPRARVVLGRELRRRALASAMLDLSDGLSGDLRHMLRASRVGAQVRLDRIPLSAEFRQALSIDGQLLELAVSGGEDYELLFSADVRHRTTLERLSVELQCPLSRIGGITGAPELEFLTAEGTIFTPGRKSYDHFSSGG